MFFHLFFFSLYAPARGKYKVWSNAVGSQRQLFQEGEESGVRESPSDYHESAKGAENKPRVTSLGPFFSAELHGRLGKRKGKFINTK